MAESCPPKQDSGFSAAINPLKCPVCTQYMTDACRLQPCMHTFCRNCIAQLDRILEEDTTGVDCPTCKTFTDLNSVVSNQIMNALVEKTLKTESQQSGYKNTTQCVQCGNVHVLAWCVDCEDHLCNNCENRHVHLKGFQDHRVQTIKKEADLFLNMPGYCLEHPKNLMELNCVPCNKGICTSCKYKEHVGHETEDIETAIERLKETITKDLLGVSHIMAEKGNTVHSLAHQLENINQNKSHIHSQIMEHKAKVVKEITELINEEYDELISDLSEITESQIKKVEKERKLLKTGLATDRNIEAWVRTILKKTNGGGLLTELQSGLVERLKQIKSTKVNKVDIYEFIPSELSVIYNISLIGEVRCLENPIKDPTTTKILDNNEFQLEDQLYEHPLIQKQASDEILNETTSPAFVILEPGPASLTQEQFSTDTHSSHKNESKCNISDDDKVSRQPPSESTHSAIPLPSDVKSATQHTGKTPSQHIGNLSRYKENPSQHAQTSPRYTEIQSQHFGTPPKNVQTSTEHLKSPPRHIEPPLTHEESLAQHSKTPPKHLGTSNQHSKAYEHHTSTPAKNIGTSPKHLENTKHTKHQSQHEGAPPHTSVHNSPHNKSTPKTMEKTKGDHGVDIGPKHDSRMAIRSFRVSNHDLTTLFNRPLNHIRDIKLKTSAFRLCVIRNHLWIPCTKEKSMKVVSLSGSLQTIHIHNVNQPRSIHKIRSERVALAAKSGLYIIDYNGHVKDRIHKGEFQDVHADGFIMAAMEKNKLHVWEISGDHYTHTNAFIIDVNPQYYNTLLVCHPYIYIGDFHGSTIHQYSITGQNMGQYEGPSVTLRNPTLCMKDDRQNMLVATYKSNRLKVLSYSGALIHTVQVDAQPWDVAIIGDIMCVLCETDKLLLYQI